MKNLGQSIRKLRELRNFSQAHLARELGMSQGNYSRIEHEDIQISPEKLAKICSILKCTPDAVLNFDFDAIYSQIEAETVPQKNAPLQQYFISPELKVLYESTIASLEKLIAELRKKNDAEP